LTPLAFTDDNIDDRLIQKAFPENLKKVVGWESVYAWNNEVFGTHQLSSLRPPPSGRGWVVPKPALKRHRPFPNRKL